MFTDNLNDEQRANMRKLVDALRSGEYNQGRGRLREDGSFCCLGVACEISGLGKWVGQGRYETSQGELHDLAMPHSVASVYGADYMGNIKIPIQIAEWISPTVDKSSFDGCVWASDMNDRGVSFDQIAEMLEQTYLVQEAK